MTEGGDESTRVLLEAQAGLIQVFGRTPTSRCLTKGRAACFRLMFPREVWL
jgi:hypothetical protein